MEIVISTPSTRTLGKSFGKRRSKRIRMEFQQCTRLAGVNTWPSTRLEAAGMELSSNPANPRRRAITFLRFLIHLRGLRKKQTEHVHHPLFPITTLPPPARLPAPAPR